MKQIRKNTFETNSSSCHTVVLSNSEIQKSNKYDFNFNQISLKNYYGTHGDTCYSIQDKIAYLITYLTSEKLLEYNPEISSKYFTWNDMLNDIFNGRVTILYDVIGIEFKDFIFNTLIPTISEKIPFHYGEIIPYEIFRDDEYLGYIDHQSCDMIDKYYEHFIKRYNLSDFTFTDFIHEIIYNDNISIEITSDGGYNQGWEDWFMEESYKEYHERLNKESNK